MPAATERIHARGVVAGVGSGEFLEAFEAELAGVAVAAGGAVGGGVVAGTCQGEVDAEFERALGLTK